MSSNTALPAGARPQVPTPCSLRLSTQRYSVVSRMPGRQSTPGAAPHPLEASLHPHNLSMGWTFLSFTETRAASPASCPALVMTTPSARTRGGMGDVSPLPVRMEGRPHRSCGHWVQRKTKKWKLCGYVPCSWLNPHLLG